VLAAGSAVVLLARGAHEVASGASAIGFGFLGGYVVLGLPAHFLLQRTAHRGVLMYLATGLVIGLVLFLPMELLNTDVSPNRSQLDLARSAALLSLSSGVAASLFWLIRLRLLASLGGGALGKPAA
jgi:hypothetical protein